MAVVIVGDVDVGRAEALVRRHFGRIPAPASRAPLPRQRLGSGFAVVYTRDTMSRYPTVTFSFVHPWKPVTTESAYRKDLSTVIYANMITYRGLSIFLNPATCVRYATKFIERFHSRDLQTSNYGAFALPPFGFEDAIAAVARETHRMREHGFEASEFDSVKAASQRGYDRTTDDRAPRPSAARAEDLVSAFADGEPALGLPAQIELGRRLTPGITLEQVNAMNREMTTPNYLVVTMASPRQPVPVPSPARVREILDREWSAPIAPGRPPIQLCNSR
jgi:zinc protease